MHKFTIKDIIHPEQALTLDGLFHQRVLRHPQKKFCHYFEQLDQSWQVITWAQALEQIGLWQAAMQAEGLQPGDRVAVMLRNCPEWVIFDQAALGLGLVTVPLYTSDRAENVAYVLQDCGAKLLLLDSGQHWSRLSDACADVSSLTRVICLRTVSDSNPLLRPVSEWLCNGNGKGNGSKEFQHLSTDPQQLASIIYTSGTTGNPKGVMLSHANLLYNAWGSLQTFDVFIDDILLSFLPLSHIFERAIGYYLVVMAGATLVYARSMQQLQEDLITIKPTLIICVPRVYERILAGINQKLGQAPRIMTVLFKLAVKVGHHRFEYQQKRKSWHPRLLLWPLCKRLVADKVLGKLGGQLRFSISGGAALSPDISRVFIGLGLPVLQGYGLTETSPVISVNRVADNQPASVGKIIPGIQVRIAENGALLTKGPHLMQGYWNSPEATKAIYTEDGWLDTGDVARLDDEGRIFITGRIKEIIVLSNGEKVPPVDIEAAIQNDPLFEQVMVVGEGKAYLSALAVLNYEQWQILTATMDFGSAWPDVLQSPQAKQFVLSRIDAQMKHFPGYAKIRRITLLAEAWSTENGLLTATQKLKRTDVLDRYRKEYETMYRGYLESTFNRGNAMKKSHVLFAVLCSSASLTASAAGFALIEQSASGMGNAFAGGSAAAEDASTIFFNPAGMTYLPDSQLVVSGHAIRPSAEFSNNGSHSSTGTATGGNNGGDAGDLSLVPNLFFSKAITPDLHLGIGLSAPFGLKTEYQNGWVGRYQALKSELHTININPSIAFKATDQLSLGFGVSAMRAEAVLSNALDLGRLFGAPQNFDALAHLKGDDWSVGWNAGAIFQFNDTTRFGLAYRSQVHEKLEGNVNFAFAAGTPGAVTGNFPNGAISAKLTLPDSLSGSLFHQLNDKWDVMTDVTWTGWSAFKNLTATYSTGTALSSTPENWQDTVRVSAGATYHYSDALKLRAGVAYDESPVPDAFRTPRIPDNDRTWLALGASYKITPAADLDVGYSHIFVKSTSINKTTDTSAAAAALRDTVIGSYDSDVNILSVQVTYNF